MDDAEGVSDCDGEPEDEDEADEVSDALPVALGLCDCERVLVVLRDWVRVRLELCVLEPVLEALRVALGVCVWERVTVRLVLCERVPVREAVLLAVAVVVSEPVGVLVPVWLAVTLGDWVAEAVSVTLAVEAPEGDPDALGVRDGLAVPVLLRVVVGLGVLDGLRVVDDEGVALWDPVEVPDCEPVGVELRVVDWLPEDVSDEVPVAVPEPERVDPCVDVEVALLVDGCERDDVRVAVCVALGVRA